MQLFQAKAVHGQHEMPPCWRNVWRGISSRMCLKVWRFGGNLSDE